MLLAFQATVDLTWAQLLFVGVPFTIAVGWLSGRVLGVHRGWRKALVAGFIGWLFGLIVASGIQQEDDLGHLAPLTLAFGVLAAMVVSIVLDVLLRPRSHHKRRLRWLLHPFDTLRRRLAPLGRLREILGYARKRGLTGLKYTSPARMATPEFARRLRLTLEDCGGMFVKFGQIASTRTDLLPEVLTTELASLQSSARPIPPEQVREVVERELGASITEEFATFDWEPLAAASIGQTHLATLTSGEEVVVKVQRPGIDEVVERDAAVLRTVSSMLERRVDAARQVHLRDLAEELIASLQRELDYTSEAVNGEVFREQRQDEEGVDAPHVFSALSTPTLLVMERVHGTSVASREAVADSGVAPAVLSRRLLSSFLEQVLRDGTFHADPHPGNVFIDHQGTLWFLDFGAVGYLDPTTLEYLQEMAIGLELRDPVILARAVRQVAGDDTMDSRALEADVGALLTETLSGGGFDPKAMSQLFDVMTRHGLRPPRTLTLLSRSMLTLEGTLRVIDRDFDLTREAQELLPDLVQQQAAGALGDQLKKELLRSLPALRPMPGHLEEIARQLRLGRLRVGVNRYGDNDRPVVDAWLDRIVFAVVGAVGLLASAVLLVAAGLAPTDEIKDTLVVLGFFGVTIASVMEMRTVAQILRRSTPDDPGAPPGGRRV